MTPTEKAIRDFCGRHADWWPSTTQVQEMLALAQPCPTCEALARTVMLDQTSHDTKRQWVGLTDEDLVDCESEEDVRFVRAIEAKLRDKNL
jgi:bacterioferritin-associated ferredoxin